MDRQRYRWIEMTVGDKQVQLQGQIIYNNILNNNVSTEYALYNDSDILKCRVCIH